ncbi:MAG: hypothetical protein LKG62_09885 [Solobacterium sp.]|jgi:hypothetical protein|uniref:hypothetical protein n=1 Tax=Lactimicrobium massiliense TaxID=2161814 RepID=UPI001FDA2947|nr:hypothetical protein [Lactimicrobium massiliense]MCI1364232.1 hypothetical protein [Solobacterium sp.]MDD6675193.1 hypothetical protein [Lactimicrobium massiliense]
MSDESSDPEAAEDDEAAAVPLLDEPQAAREILITPARAADKNFFISFLLTCIHAINILGKSESVCNMCFTFVMYTEQYLSNSETIFKISNLSASTW